jgi:hypothetical protein
MIPRRFRSTLACQGFTSPAGDGDPGVATKKSVASVARVTLLPPTVAYSTT